MGTTALQTVSSDLNVDLDLALKSAFDEGQSSEELKGHLGRIATSHNVKYGDARQIFQGRFVWALSQGTLTPAEVNGASKDLQHFFGVKADS